MKIVPIFFLAFSITIQASAQNTPVQEKGAPESNNALPSNGTLGSKSGVNPMGNPGTIANSSASNSAVNSGVAPHPNVEPGVFLSSSPEGTVIGTTVNTGNGTVRQASTVSNAGTVTAAVVEEQKTTATPKVTAPTTAPAAITVVEPAPAKATVTVTATPAPKLPAYTPLRGNFISEQALAAINAKYGASVYDIRAIRIESTRKVAYIVRLLDDGKLRSELFSEQQ